MNKKKSVLSYLLGLLAIVFMLGVTSKTTAAEEKIIYEGNIGVDVSLTDQGTMYLGGGEINYGEYQGLVYGPVSPTIKKIVFNGKITASESFSIFSQLRDLEEIENFSNYDISKLTSFKEFFYDTPKLKKIDADMSKWDTSKITDMSSMFSHSGLEKLDIGSWDVSNVMDMSEMFFLSKAKKLDIGSWDVSNVRDMSSMFSQASVSELNLSNWNTKNVENMSIMFSWVKVPSMDLSKWDTSSVTGTSSMFTLAEIDNLDLSNWNRKSITNTYDMFSDVAFGELHLANWELSSNSNALSELFSNIQKLDYLDLTNVDIKNSEVHELFEFIPLKKMNVTGWADNQKNKDFLESLPNVEIIGSGYHQKSVNELMIKRLSGSPEDLDYPFNLLEVWDGDKKLENGGNYYLNFDYESNGEISKEITLSGTPTYKDKVKYVGSYQFELEDQDLTLMVPPIFASVTKGTKLKDIPFVGGTFINEKNEIVRGTFDWDWEKIANTNVTETGEYPAVFRAEGYKPYYFTAKIEILNVDTTGWFEKDGKLYYYQDGKKVTGWLRHDTYWYYFDEAGVMQTGWLQSGGKWYYLYETGRMADNEWIYPKGNHDWFLIKPNGEMAVGLTELGDETFYFGPLGDMRRDFQWINSQWYFFGTSGNMAKNQWRLVNDKWYYLDESGVMLTGWQYINGKWYYLTSSGAMATGWFMFDGEWYYFDANGNQMKNGWFLINNHWYYFYVSGQMARNVNIGGYYLNGNGTY